MFTVDDMVLGVVAGYGEEGCAGRTRIQKYGYFIGRQLGIDAGFINHCFGPYSPLVTRRLNALVRCGILKEGRDAYGEREAVVWVNDKIGFHYTYSLSVVGREVYGWRRSEEEALYERAEEVLKWLRRRCKDDILTLVVASKLHQVSLGRGDTWETVADEEVLSQWLNCRVERPVIDDSSACVASLLRDPPALVGAS